MFREVKDAVDRGEVLLDESARNGAPEMELVKDHFVELRKKASWVKPCSLQAILWWLYDQPMIHVRKTAAG